MVLRARRALLAGVVLTLAAGGALAGHGAYLAAKASLAQVLLRHAWAQTRHSGEPHRPWFWADTYPVARLRVPALGVEQIVLAGSSGRTLAFGPGHLPGTARPGETGLSLVSGHRDTHFRFLEALRPGHELYIHTAGGAVKRYVVQRAEAFDLIHGSLSLDPVADQLVLVTCYPFRHWRAGGTGRYVVILEPEAAST